MNARYWKGVALGLAACLVLGVGVRRWLSAVPPLSPDEALIFDPPLFSAMSPWILPGQSREFTAQLHNRGGTAAVIDELRFSCPCSTGRLGESGRFPVTIAPGEALPVQVTVTSQRAERGRVEFRYGVLGRIGDDRVNPGALAEFEFAQVLNADPPLVALGAFARTDEAKSATVSIWSPAEVVPTAALSVETLEPALTAVLTSVAGGDRLPPASGSRGRNMRVPLATLTITLDPKIAPERLKADVVVRAGADEVRIPVLGILDTSSRSEPSGE